MTRARDVANIDGLLTTTGDTYYASAAGTPTRLGIGSTAQVLTVASGVPSWATPASSSKIGQVVNATFSTLDTNTTTSYDDTGLTATITPTLNTSKILVIINQGFSVYRTSATAAGGFWRLLRGSTDLVITGTSESLYMGGASGNINLANLGFTITYLDSPATTSATTYKTQTKASVSGTEATTQGGSQISSITLLEVLA